MHTPHTICLHPDSEGIAYNTQHTGGIVLLGDLEKLKNMQQSTQKVRKKNLIDVNPPFFFVMGVRDKLHNLKPGLKILEHLYTKPQFIMESQYWVQCVPSP